MDVEYKEYLHKFKRKQNRGAGGRVDSEKSKTYAAEHAFMRKVKIKQFTSLKEAQKRAKQIYATKKWQKVWQLERDTDRVTSTLRRQPAVVLKERNTGRGTAGWTNGRTVTLDSHAGLDEYTLLHELAHCLGHMHHGRSFRRALLELVGGFMGTEAKKILKVEFKKRKLAFGKASKPMSIEQWRFAKQHMENIRNGRK
jgi:putative metallohydrolase (TIGR04338 family)